MALASPALAAPDAPQGRWTGRLECTRAVLICADLPVVMVIAPMAPDGKYRATLTYVVNGVEYPGPALTFGLNGELHTLTAHATDFSEHQFWALRLNGDSMSGVRMVNTRITDRTIYLVRDKTF